MLSSFFHLKHFLKILKFTTRFSLKNSFLAWLLLQLAGWQEGDCTRCFLFHFTLVTFFSLAPLPAAALPATTGLPQQAVSPVPVPLHLKDDRPHRSSPGSPVIFTQQSTLKEPTPHHPSPQLPPLCTTASNLVSSSPLSHSSNASSPVPVSQPPIPSVNLQAMAKYVDKNLSSQLSNWPTDLIDRQVRT